LRALLARAPEYSRQFWPGAFLEAAGSRRGRASSARADEEAGGGGRTERRGAEGRGGPGLGLGQRPGDPGDVRGGERGLGGRAGACAAPRAQSGLCRRSGVRCCCWRLLTVVVVVAAAAADAAAAAACRRLQPECGESLEVLLERACGAGPQQGAAQAFVAGAVKARLLPANGRDVFALATEAALRHNDPVGHLVLASLFGAKVPGESRTWMRWRTTRCFLA
jgi:hypothetical protein